MWLHLGARGRVLFKPLEMPGSAAAITSKTGWRHRIQSQLEPGIRSVCETEVPLISRILSGNKIRVVRHAT